MIEFLFGDGPRVFALPIKQLQALQERRNAGPLALVRTIETGNWQVEDVIDTLRLGLIGGGLPLHQADALVQTGVADLGLVEAARLAVLILADALAPRERSAEGKAPAPAAATETDASGSAIFTEPAPL